VVGRALAGAHQRGCVQIEGRGGDWRPWPGLGATHGSVLRGSATARIATLDQAADSESWRRYSRRRLVISRECSPRLDSRRLLYLSLPRQAQCLTCLCRAWPWLPTNSSFSSVHHSPCLGASDVRRSSKTVSGVGKLSSRSCKHKVCLSLPCEEMAHLATWACS